ncbi:hypothetical protein ABEV00_10130 [Paenibacillus thiaminolyticus]|uniref:hypothetical protein n=1 Tax=Paenibacillus thiaminolyticus TaxID=49283 RepID=UPI003D283503
MKLKSLIIAICLLSAFSITSANAVSATEEGYHSSLEKMGIDYETYKNMPEDKQNLYDNIIIKDIQSSTKYYKYSEPRGVVLKSLINESKMQEISEGQFLFETSAYLDANFISALKEDTNKTETSWVKMTTKLGTVSTNEWVLSNDVTYIKSNGFLQPKNTHIIGLGGNSNFSVIKDSEYLKREYTLYSSELGIYEPGQTQYYWTADEKAASGYAYTFDIVESEISNTAFMALRIKPNVSNATVVDGFGHYSKYSLSVSPSLSFSSGGADLSISPTSKLSTAPKTHVQLNR